MKKSKILVVEDDDDLRQGLTLRLKASGYDVVLACDGLAAVSVARTERPDLILLDIGLPGGNGLTVLQRYSDCRRTHVHPGGRADRARPSGSGGRGTEIWCRRIPHEAGRQRRASSRRRASPAR